MSGRTDGKGGKGLVLVLTGNGKGKTTSALGLVFRALGHGFPVSVIQFIKGSWKYGELEAAKRFGDLLDFHVMGRGFTWKSDDLAKDRAMAREAWEFAAATIREGRHRLVVLDEITYAINYKIIDEREVIETLAARPESVHVVVTGRDAPEGLRAAADLVTEMQDVKHHHAAGVKAQKGIEF